MKRILRHGLLFLLAFALASCTEPAISGFRIRLPEAPAASDSVPEPAGLYHYVTHDVPIRRYFEYLDSVVREYDTLMPYTLSEHLLVRANPWLIDSLAETDYYRLMARDSFVYDPRSLLALRRGDSLLIPDSLLAGQLTRRMAETVIDINIPEFTLRIMEAGHELYAFPVRVGQNRIRYLEMAGGVVDLRTRTGTGYIVRLNRNPRFANPVDNHPYTSTLRDDGRRTLLPRIPWIEPMLNGERYGQLIHPTTNPETLGKAYSNGCIGMAEADMWRVYYHAPIGTRVVVRYTLRVIGPEGDTIRLRDLYPRRGRQKKAVAAVLPRVLADLCCLCGESDARPDQMGDN